MMLTLPATVSPGMSGVTALETTICEAMAEGTESNRASRPSGLTTLIPSKLRVVQ